MNDVITLPTLSFVSIKVAELHPDPAQPRKKRNEQSDAELAESMRTNGMLQTILVREKDGCFIIINGERRWSAATTLGWEKVDCLVTTASSERALVLQVVENVQRDSLCAEDLATHLRVLMSQHQEIDNKASLRALAVLVGKSAGWVSEKLALARLPDGIRALRDNKTIKNSRVLIGLSKLTETNPEAAAILVKEIEDGKSVSVGLINEVRGSIRKKRDVPHKEAVLLSDLPESVLHVPHQDEAEAVPSPARAVKIESGPDAAATRPRRKKQVEEVAMKIGVSADLPLEELLEAFAAAYAKLLDEKVLAEA